MKKGRILTAALCLLLAVSGCQTPEPTEDPSREPVRGTTAHTETSGAATTTAVLAVTDAEGSVVTDPDGQTVTEIVTGLPTQIRTATDKDGATITEIVVPPVITVETDPKGGVVTDTVTEHRVTTTTSQKAGKDTTKPASSTAKTTTKQTPSVSKATTTTTTTTRKPTSTTTTTTQKPTETEPQPSGPWYAPYDLTQIYAECKREIERLGMVWEEGLRPDSLGVSWANPDNTVVYTYYPEMFHLREYVIDELIPEYKNKPYSRQSCRIWLEPYAESPGDYWIYFLERR